MRFHGRSIVRGCAEGRILLSVEPISFYGGVDPETGVVTEPGHCVEGESIRDRILVFPRGKGSTVGSYIIYRMKKIGVAPSAILNSETDMITATGCVMAGIPLMDRFEESFFKALKSGCFAKLDAGEGWVELFSSLSWSPLTPSRRGL
ncbi:MAG: aconitase X swivel domain-containing protein [Candidatus Bathyarchaeia archaeon]